MLLNKSVRRLLTLPARLMLFLLPAALMGLSGCGAYSFSGTTISPDIKTLSIQTFINNSGSGPAGLQQTFSEKMRDYFQRNTRLAQVRQAGDLQFDGSIVGYDLAPLSPTSADQASQTRLTMRVKVNFINTKDAEQNFEQEFSFFADFPAGQSLTVVETGLIDRISDQIILLIFNKSVANW